MSPAFDMLRTSASRYVCIIQANKIHCFSALFWYLNLARRQST